MHIGRLEEGFGILPESQLELCASWKDRRRYTQENNRKTEDSNVDANDDCCARQS